MGKDFTLFALSDGQVKFDKPHRRVHVEPKEESAVSTAS